MALRRAFDATMKDARFLEEAAKVDLEITPVTGEAIDAAEAHRIGLVNRVVPKGRALAEAKVMVAVYAERAPEDLQVVKVTEANLTYVAIDREGKARPIPRPLPAAYKHFG